MSYKRSASSGFTLIEVLTVCAIIGVVALIAYPNMVRFKEQQQTKAGATKMAGVLDEARSRASGEATPYLVYVNERAPSADGTCGSAATMVRDSDRTYSVTAGDDVREIALDAETCRVTKPFGDPGAPVDVSIPMPSQDLAVRGLEGVGSTVSGLVGGAGGAGGAGGVGGLVSGLVGAPAGGESETGAAPERSPLAETVVNGATFPIDEDSGRPVIAFSERGIPVDPQNPTSWGSGAGAIYLTDGHATVYAAVVQPLGDVQLRVFDSASREWR